MTALLLVLDPPLVPSGDQARAELRRELLRREYHQRDLAQQVLDWVQRRLQSGLDAAHDAPPLSTLAAMVLFVALVAALAALLSRARRTTARARLNRAVLTDERVTAAELRTRARAAQDAGRFREALVDGFRALTLQQVERGVLDDAPGATAREVSISLGAELAAYAEELAAAAERFDAVRYGDQPASAGEAERVLALDAALLGARRVLR